MSDIKKLRIAFVHPDLGIGGAERLVVDAAVGLQKLGHTVDIYTSHHDSSHCFEETRDGTLTVHAIHPPLPRAWRGKFHIFFSHARQLHLTYHLLSPSSPKYDVYFVDQLSTCVPLLRTLAKTRVVFYCHFPDKLLADGAYEEGKVRKSGSLLKRVYRWPMDKLEEITTRQADVILANSHFTSRIFKTHFRSINVDPEVVYPGINLSSYEPKEAETSDPDVAQVVSERPTFLSLNRFEKKKNALLAIDAFALLREEKLSPEDAKSFRLVIAGGYDPRLEDNMMTLVGLIDRAKKHSLTFDIIQPQTSKLTIPPFNTTSDSPTILFLLNFTTAQRSALLSSPSTLCLLYTPMNEHFGIGPVEAMVCGLPVVACNSGGPKESVLNNEGDQYTGGTGWLRPPDSKQWAEALYAVTKLSEDDRKSLAAKAQSRAKENFGMDAMASGLERAMIKAVSMGPVDVTNQIWGTLFMIFVALMAIYYAWLEKSTF
ncbi:Alpha-1,3/1,6-mannosyltransferase ALG2 [Abortiporus biennis]